MIDRLSVSASMYTDLGNQRFQSLQQIKVKQTGNAWYLLYQSQEN